MKTVHLALALLTFGHMAMAEAPVLNVLTYDSFAADWGPRPGHRQGISGHLRLHRPLHHGR